MASELLESDKLRLFLLLDGTLINYNEYLERFENATELIVRTEEQTKKLVCYFYIKRFLLWLLVINEIRQILRKMLDFAKFDWGKVRNFVNYS